VVGKPGRVAEGQRNRERLLEAAAAAYAADPPGTLESIAAEAGVGIGTLYRHFPTREALVQAVYADQVARLGATATRLLRAHEPAEALRRWGRRFVDWARTKHGMSDALRALMADGRLDAGGMRAQLVEVVTRFLEAGAEAGDLRTDVRAEDVAAMLAGVMSVAGEPGQAAQARRMVDLVVDGLRA
jgi:AcrR family transcriptional regulator